MRRDASVRASVRANIQATVTASVPGESNQDSERRSGKATFPRGARLLRHADFERVYKQGRRHFSALMTVFYLERQTQSAAGPTGLRVGFTVGRALGGAVQRNRMKRRLREAVRLTRPASGASADVVINPKKVILTADFEAILNEMRQAFVVIETKLTKGKSGRTGVSGEQSQNRKPKAGSR